MGEIIIILVILGYIGNVLLARKLNHMIYDLDNDYYPLKGLWFVPVIPILLFLMVYASEKWSWMTRLGDWIRDKRDGFNGENW
jgi:hypothetical protein